MHAEVADRRMRRAQLPREGRPWGLPPLDVMGNSKLECVIHFWVLGHGQGKQTRDYCHKDTRSIEPFTKERLPKLPSFVIYVS